MQSQQSPGISQRPSTLIWATLLITLGAVLLLNNLEVLPWTIWVTLGRLWPVVLIALGAEILLGRSQPAAGAFAAAFLIFVVAAVTLLYVYAPATFGVGAVPAIAHQENISIPLANSQRGDVSLSVGVAQVNLTAAPTSSPDLIHLVATLPPYSRIEQSQTSSGSIARASVVERNDQQWSIPFSRSDQSVGYSWDVQVTPRVPLTLAANLGVGQSTLDLSNLNVTDLQVTTGVGDTTVTLPSQAETTTGTIGSGVGHLTLIVPANVGARIFSSGGIGGVNASSRFHTEGGAYVTDNYNSAPNQLDLNLHLGVGSVDIR